jgi:hypothetical protein
MKFIFPWGFILWYPEKAKVGTKVSTSTSDGIWDGVCLACAILLSRSKKFQHEATKKSSHKRGVE